MKDLFKIYLRVYQRKHIVFSFLAILFLIFDVLIVLGIPAITKYISTKSTAGLAISLMFSGWGFLLPGSPSPPSP